MKMWGLVIGLMTLSVWVGCQHAHPALTAQQQEEQAYRNAEAWLQKEITPKLRLVEILGSQAWVVQIPTGKKTRTFLVKTWGGSHGETGFTMTELND